MLLVQPVIIVFFFILQIKNLTSQAQRNSGAASVAVDELRQARSRLDAYNSKIGELESANASLLVSA
jgi:lamin B